MTPAQKRELVHRLHRQEGVPVAVGCRLLNLARSSCYYCSTASENIPLVAAVTDIATRFTTYGSRRITQELRREPYARRVNRKRIQRVMRRHVARPRARSGCRTTNSAHGQPRYPNLVKDVRIERPEQVWACDITYIRLNTGFVYLAIILDVFTRAIRGWHLHPTLDGELSLRALQRALAERRPEIHHSDQGSHYAAQAYTALLQQHGIQISMAARGQPLENPYAERVIRTLKQAEVYLSDYQDFTDVWWQVGRFIDDVYNVKRIHSALGYLTPVEFEQRWCEALEAVKSPLR